MKYVLWSFTPLACPRCGSANIARSHDKNFFDYLLRTVCQIKPYRCMSCDYRHYRFRPSTSHGGNALPSAPK